MKRNAQMAELVDAQVSGICAARRGGSSPLLGTILIFSPYNLLFLLNYFLGAGKYFKGEGIEVYNLFYFCSFVIASLASGTRSALLV